MSKLIGTLLSSALLLGTSASAYAGTRTPSINAREHHQQERIAHGIASGRLSAKEATRLEVQQAEIRFDEAKARSDGHVTFAERVHIQHELDHTSRHIFKQKHD